MSETQEFPLDNLVNCNQCGAPMKRGQERISLYTCTGRHDETEPCPAPSLRARDLNLHIIPQITRVLMKRGQLDTYKKSVAQRLAQIGERMPGDEELWEIIATIDTEFFIPTNPNRARRARSTLEELIKGIRISHGEAVVEYKKRLPRGTLMAGKNIQEIGLPTSIVE